MPRHKPFNSELEQAIEQYREWLSKKVVPHWTSKGIDEQGASYECFLANGFPDIKANKRLRVQARQMFSFAYGQQRGWLTNGAELITRIDKFIEQYAKNEGKHSYVHVLDSENKVLNSHQDLYDCAFFLLAYGWRYHVFGDLKSLDKANRLLEQIDIDLKHSPGGWGEGDYSYQVRRQNPHMHLFEAFLALYQVTKKGKWLAKAGEIFCLFETCFFDHEHGVLLEYFDEHWHPTSINGEYIVEPGHMFEWVWLLREYHKLTDTPVDYYCEKLYHNAVRLGVEPSSNTVFDEVNIHGKILKSSKRCWPMTEWVKASLAQVSAINSTGYDYEADAIKAINALLRFYAKDAGYIDQLDDQNQIKVDLAPASTLYHLVMAEAETNRYLSGYHNVYQP